MKLSVQDLNSHYGPAHILFDIALEVGDGEVVALLGRNGAGKSTTFRSIIGLVEQRTGRIVFEGRDISDAPTHAIVRGGLGYVPEERRIFTDLTVEENLEVGRQPSRPNAPTWDRKKLFALFPNLGEMRGRQGGRMSGGEQQMLTIAWVGASEISRPSKTIRPVRCSTRPMMERKVVDLPAPLRPSSATTSPSPTSRAMSNRM